MTVTRIYWQPRSQFDSFVTQLERMFDRANVPSYPQTSTPASPLANPQPKIETIENDRTFWVRVELPGIERKNIEVNASDRIVKIVGRRHRNSEGRALIEELGYGTFERFVTFPQAIDNTEITADLTDGILTLTVPKRSAQRPERVKVNLCDADSSTLNLEKPEKSNLEQPEIEEPQAELVSPTRAQTPSELTEDVWNA